MVAVRFPKTEVVFNSAVHRDIFTKFGSLRTPDLLRTIALSNWNWKLICNVNGRHLENFSDSITAPTIHMKFGWPMQNVMPMTIGRSKSKQK